ncbi:ethanolamine utilization protein EutQ (plasmid) [Rhizobium sp. Pop5]|uniref:ethanolamine utilization protein EutQ n=1 Tax=Rhizobium sp. Pop5 TaxID=1223565 RepID=UPI0002838585|nr:ethanolamine utilization protein EutQ [Rhizobium sp. Pop5]EJZ22725.1 ethanolamine utilization protein EutQ [Rhizobium sp. Pop5]UVD60219.1 ethanolamine utilization protein EutQ [Rhizobium sp. Pop5]
MHREPTVFRKDTTEFAAYGEGPGEASIARLVGPQESETMGAYLARFNGRSVPWTVRYDELITCIEGAFRLRVGLILHTLHPGDVIWIPKDTELAYDGADSLVFIAIAPVDWRNRLSQDATQV